MTFSTLFSIFSFLAQFLLLAQRPPGKIHCGRVSHEQDGPHPKPKLLSAQGGGDGSYNGGPVCAGRLQLGDSREQPNACCTTVAGRENAAQQSPSTRLWVALAQDAGRR